MRMDPGKLRITRHTRRTRGGDTQPRQEDCVAAWTNVSWSGQDDRYSGGTADGKMWRKKHNEWLANTVLRVRTP